MADKNNHELIVVIVNDGPKFGDCDIKIESNMKNGVSFANSNCNFFLVITLN